MSEARDAWKRRLAELRVFLTERQAENAAWGVSLEARKAEADAQVAEAEAKIARLAAEAELADAAFERDMHERQGGRLQ